MAKAYLQNPWSVLQLEPEERGANNVDNLLRPRPDGHIGQALA